MITLTNDILSKLDEIDRECNSLHLPCPPKTIIEMVVRDPCGNEIERVKGLSQSWVRNMHNYMVSVLTGADTASGGTTFGAGKLPGKDVDGNARYYDGDVWAPYVGGGSGTSEQFYYNPSANTLRGIVIGTGTNADSLEDYALQTTIAHGTGAGQMTYNAQSAPTVSYDSGTKVFTVVHSRIFNNNSAGSITVNEVGLIYYATTKYNDPRYYLMSRDKQASGATIPSGGSLTVTYTMTHTFPA